MQQSFHKLGSKPRVRQRLNSSNRALAQYLLKSEELIVGGKVKVLSNNLYYNDNKTWSTSSYEVK